MRFSLKTHMNKRILLRFGKHPYRIHEEKRETF